MDIKLREINVGIDKERPTTIQQNDQSNGSHEQPNQQHTKVLPKSENGSAYLDVPLRGSSRTSLDSISNVSLYSADNVNERSSRLSLRSEFHNRIPSRSPAPPRTWRGRSEVFWQGNKGFLLVLIAEFFGAFMTAATRLLETDESHGERMHPFQVGCVRHVRDQMWECVPNTELDPLRPNGGYSYTFYGVYVVGKSTLCSFGHEGGAAVACPTGFWRLVRWYVLKDACLLNQWLTALSYGSLL